MSAQSSPVLSIFKSAMSDFKNKLKNDAIYAEILKTTSIEQVYDLTDKLQHEQAQKGHLRHLSKLEPYLRRLQEYSGTIEVFIQVKPDILSLIWGPLKLLLQWTSVLKQSFDAIINTTAKIGHLLPEFIDVAQMFSQNTQINDVLALFFRDILDFYLIALKFFSQSRWRYVFEALWPRHKDKIDVVATNIERHSLLLRNDVRLEHVKQEHEARLRALDHFDRTQKALRKQEFRAIKADISPIDHGRKLDSIKAQKCPGTGKWLMREKSFEKWMDISNKDSRILWLQGIPGAGKTYLSSDVIEKKKSSGQSIFAFLSYTHMSSTTAASILHSLIFQLASDNDDLEEIFCELSRENLKSDTAETEAILKKLLSCSGPVYVIIDGVDEVEEIERGRLLTCLLTISKECEETHILISSRPEADIESKLRNEAVVLCVNKKNSGSIQAFVNQSSQKWFKERSFVQDVQEELRSLLLPLASNAEGTFLYAKVVLHTIRWLDDVEMIRQELKAPPKDLKAAYDRILSRVNSLEPPLREKARKLLGWIGCSPTPLTLQEIQQALMVKLGDFESKPRVISKLNLVAICGPIVEVADNYVQFVHFTAKEYVRAKNAGFPTAEPALVFLTLYWARYILSDAIPGFIDYTEATLSLAMTCIAYLCQSHHHQDISDEELSKNILDGIYTFDDYAYDMWFKLVQCYVWPKPHISVSPDLIDLLSLLLQERANSEFKTGATSSSYYKLDCFKSAPSEVYSLLCRVDDFRRLCDKAEYNKGNDTSWIGLDPLTTSQTAVRIHNTLTLSLSKPEIHYWNAIHEHYGPRPLKCGFLECAHRRHGFESMSAQTAHEKHHNRPWKCSEPSCQYADGGFLSRTHRDKHLACFHQAKRIPEAFSIQTSDKEELQALIFDMIKLDNLDAVSVLLPEIKSFDFNFKEALRDVICAHGSINMFELTRSINERHYFDVRAMGSMTPNNLELLRYILSQKTELVYGRGGFLLSLLDTIISSDSESLVDAFEKNAEYQMKNGSLNLPSENVFYYARSSVIESTKGYAHREEVLVKLWEKRLTTESDLGQALINVASTTCSMRLTTCLLNRGAKVDYRLSSRFSTALQHAARNPSAEAARLMQFLLQKGADPYASRSSARKIEEERGAKNISKWLGKSWEDLVAETKEELDKIKNDQSAT